ncbi:MAG: ABC transporter permease [Deltaproteobacteria bacterium]|nr:ABC transporter permease [Deltaproteobacteria bacterium]
MWTFLSLAFRGLVRNRGRSLLTLLAITVGVGVVIFGSAFGEGVVDTMVQQVVNARAGALQVHRKGYMDSMDAAPLKLDLPDSGAVLEATRSTPGVRAVTRRIRFGGMLNNGTRSSMVMGAGLDPVEEFAVCPDRRAEVPETGTHVRADADHGAVLGGELARSYGVKPGDTLTVTAAGREGAVNALDIDVVGLTRGAAALESKRQLMVPLSHAQGLLGMPGRVTEYVVAVDDLRQLHDVQARLSARLGPEYEVHSWEQVMPFLYGTVGRMRMILGGVSLVLFVMVVFGVINTMLMSVYERVREIGTMLAVGMRRGQVLRLFLLEAAALGLVGGGLGAVLGLAATLYYSGAGIVISPPGSVVQQVVRPEASPAVALAAVAVAMVGALLAAAYPAARAARMNPVDALRTV